MANATIDPELLNRCHRNFVESFWQLARSAPNAKRISLDTAEGAELLSSAFRVSAANVLFIRPEAGAPESTLQRARVEFGPHTPWRVVAVGPATEKLGRVAITMGLRPLPREPGMLLDPIPPLPPSPAGLAIRRVATLGELRDWGIPWAAAFRVPRAAFRLLQPVLPVDDPARGAQVRFFVGYKGTRPVACASIVVTEGIAGIYSVGTTPSARGRGFGAAITARAVEEGRLMGATSAYLVSTKMGYPVYQRLGFVPVCDYQSWEVPLTLFGGIRVLLEIWWMDRRASRRP